MWLLIKNGISVKTGNSYLFLGSEFKHPNKGLKKDRI